MMGSYQAWNIDSSLGFLVTSSHGEEFIDGVKLVFRVPLRCGLHIFY